MDELKQEFLDDLRFKMADIFSGKKVDLTRVFEHRDGGVDAILKVQLLNREVNFFIEVKSEVHSLLQVRNTFEKFKQSKEGTYFLVSPYISGPVKEFITINGGGYYEFETELFFPVQTWLELKKGKSRISEQLLMNHGYRSDITSKLIVLYASNPSHYFKKSQRELSEILDVSLGTINKGINRLIENKMIYSRMGHVGSLNKVEVMANVWRSDLLKLERDKMSLGRFSPVNENFYSNWHCDLRDLNAYWAGEPAAAIRTNYLSPGAFKIYTYDDKPNKLLHHLRLKKDVNGSIEILKCFWPDEVNNKLDGTVPDFVTYCELLNSGVDRNLETARILHDMLEERLSNWIWDYGRKI